MKPTIIIIGLLLVVFSLACCKRETTKSPSKPDIAASPSKSETTAPPDKSNADEHVVRECSELYRSFRYLQDKGLPQFALQQAKEGVYGTPFDACEDSSGLRVCFYCRNQTGGFQKVSFTAHRDQTTMIILDSCGCH